MRLREAGVGLRWRSILLASWTTSPFPYSWNRLTRKVGQSDFEPPPAIGELAKWASSRDHDAKSLGEFAGVEKEFEVAFGTRQAAGFDGDGLEVEGFGGGLDGLDGLLVKARGGNDAARADVFAAKFELRFDEDEEVGVRTGAADCGWQYFCDGDEGDVSDDQTGQFG